MRGPRLNRREWLWQGGLGIGGIAAACLSADDGPANASDSPRAPALPPTHFAPKAKRVIHLFMNGGPSQIDTFDPKPLLRKHAGQSIGSAHLLTERPTGALMASPFQFKKHGQSGLEISELFPRVAECADELCVIRSMRTDFPNHEPALMLMNCGDSRQIRPSLGSWAVYGLGSVNQDLPGFVVLCPNGYPTFLGAQNWQSAFLPPISQGTFMDTSLLAQGGLLANLSNERISHHEQQRQLEMLRRLHADWVKNSELDQAFDSRMKTFELAFRMQTEFPQVFDLAREPQSVREMYGETIQGKQMLLARRLLQHGVRFVQTWHGTLQPWDTHDDNDSQHRALAAACDQPIAALLKDLRRLGMLDDTLVIWGGEFGRTPTVELPVRNLNQGSLAGRDHNPYGFSVWLAGGGVRRGIAYGRTDDFGFKVVENPMHVHDLHATILQLLGLDHTRLTFRHAGRDYRLTDVAGRVVKDIIA